VTTDDRLDRLIFLMECALKHFKVRVPRPKTDAPTALPPDSVTVIHRGRGARLVPEEQGEGGVFPSSTVRSLDDWRRER
jgi:hypothetical protein